MAKSTYYRPAKDQATPVHDQLFLATLDRVGTQGIEDMITIDRPTLAMMMAIKDTVLLAGAEQARIDVETSYNPTGGWVDEVEGISLDDYDPWEALYYWPKHLARGVVWTKQQQRVNRNTPQQVFSIVERKFDNTIETLKRDLSVGLFGDGGGKLMDGLRKLIPAVAKESQTTLVGGKNPADFVWHRTQATDMSGRSAVTDLSDDMLTMWNTIYIQLGKTDYICCDQRTCETYEKNAREFLFTGPTKIGDMQFELVQYKRKPVMFDAEAPVGEMRFIDKKQIKLLTDPMFWFRWTDYKEPLNLPFQKHKQIVCDCNMGRIQARRLGCIFNITESGT